jgi:hypothetical protein
MEHHIHKDFAEQQQQQQQQHQESVLPTCQHLMEISHDRCCFEYHPEACHTAHTHYGQVIPTTSLPKSPHSNKRQRDREETTELSYCSHLSPHNVPVLSSQCTMEVRAQYENNYFSGHGDLQPKAPLPDHRHQQYSYPVPDVVKSNKRVRLEQPVPVVVHYNPQEQYLLQNAELISANERTLIELYGPPPPYDLVVQNLQYYKTYVPCANNNHMSGGTSLHGTQPQVPVYQNHLDTRPITDNSVYYYYYHHHQPEGLSPKIIGNNDSNFANEKPPVGQQGLRSPSKHTWHRLPTKQQDIILTNENKADATVPSDCDRLNIAKQVPVRQSKKQFLPASAVDILKTWFYEHINYPYPTAEERAYLSEITGLTHLQITNWFTNERKRKWTPKMRKQQEEINETAGDTKQKWNPRNIKKILRESSEDPSVAQEYQTDTTASA